MDSTLSRLFARLAGRAPRPEILPRGAGRTSVGRRANNQDAMIVRDDLALWAVADGMGGYEGGEVASHATTSAIERLYQDHRADADCTWPVMAPSERSVAADRAALAIELAHRAVRAERRGPLAQMGSTIVLAALDGCSLVVAHAGDSRCYRLRRGVLTLLTRDHSFLNDFGDHRPLTPEDRERMEAQFGHVVTRAVGHGDALTPTVSELPVEPGDRYLLSSDGVHGWLSETELASALSAGEPTQAAEQLVARALDDGSSDNLTAVVVAIDRA